MLHVLTTNRSGVMHATRSAALSWPRFFTRYPVFLLGLGPPIFRLRDISGDTSKAHADMWNVLQVGWLAAIAVYSAYRLISRPNFQLAGRVLTVFKIVFLIGLLFICSILYSPGWIVSAEFSLLYILTWISILEFVVSCSERPPDLIQSLFALRGACAALLLLILLMAPVSPATVIGIEPGVGIRFTGGTIAHIPIIAPFVAIVSAYSYLYSLEPRLRASLLFLLGITGTILSLSRGADLALTMVLAMMLILWAKRKSRTTYLVAALFTLSTVAAAVLLVTLGGGNLWNTFNRGQGAADILSASGRTQIWRFALSYSLTHPQGMGYVAGFRGIFTRHYDLFFNGDISKLGNTHNSYIQYLVDAGWLALALYLAMLVKVLIISARHLKKFAADTSALANQSTHAVRCASLLLAFCLLEGLEAADFTIPLQGAFYLQCLAIGVILGAHTVHLSKRPSQHTQAPASHTNSSRTSASKARLISS